MTRQNGQRFLVALDGSDHSRAIIDYIERIIPPRDQEFVLFHVYQKVPDYYWDLSGKGAVPWEDSGMEDLRNRDVMDFLETARMVLVGAGFKPSSIVIRSKEVVQGVARDIVAEIHKGYNGVMAGQRGLNNLRELVMGGVTTKLIQNLRDVPLILISKNGGNNKFLVAFDGSGGSMEAIDFLGTTVGGAKVDVTLFHALRAFQKQISKPDRPEILWEAGPDWINDHLRFIDGQMNEARNRLVARGIHEDNIFLETVTGVPSRAGAILEAARNGDMGTIVGGRRGLTRIMEHSMGTVTAKIAGMARRRAVWIVAS